MDGRRPCDVFHNIVRLDVPGIGMLQCKFYFLFIELFDAGNGIGCIRHQRVAGNIIDPVSCGKGVKAEGLGMHEPDGDFVGGRPVYNAQVGSMNINGVIMGGSQHAILDDDFSPASGKVQIIRPGGIGAEGTGARRPCRAYSKYGSYSRGCFCFCIERSRSSPSGYCGSGRIGPVSWLVSLP